jgi:hypothetical protein
VNEEVAKHASTSYFDIRGVVLAVKTGDDQIADAIRRRLARHEVSSPIEPADVSLSFQREPPGPTQLGGRTVYDSTLGPVVYRQDEDTLSLSGDGFSFACLGGEGHSYAAIDPSAPRPDWLGSRPLLTLSLLETLRRRGLFGVHAASVEREGQSVVIAGGSGVGKSTLALSLTLHGFSFMGDDLVFADRRSGALRVGALCEELDVTAWTAANVLGLDAAATPADEGWPKYRVSPETIFGDRIAIEAAPALVLFPNVAQGERGSRAMPVPSGDALGRLAPDILLTNRAAVSAHLSALGALAEASRCFELTVGSNADETADLVCSLL